ncbi:MAG: thioredoxin domain-containing protein [bacterium]
MQKNKTINERIKDMKEVKNSVKNNVLQYLVVAVIVVGAYMIGVYKTKVEYLEKGSGNVGAGVQQQGAQQAPAKQAVEMANVEALFGEKGNLVFGKKGAKIKFVEFSDPSCPYCHIASGLDPELNNEVGAQFKLVSEGGTYVPPEVEIKKLVDEGKAQLVWFYTPGHGSGELATLALYCANDKGKFWEAHALLMSNKGYTFINETVQNDREKAPDMANFLSSAVDSAFMQSCLESGKYDERITSDPQVAGSFGYGATPTFFINDQVVEGAASWDQAFQPLVDLLL